MRSRMILMTMVIAIGGIRAGNANPLQITEARQELSRISVSKADAKRSLEQARLAYNGLRTAARRQQKALNMLIKADESKQLAQRSSVNAVENGRIAQPYYADQGHSMGNARIVEGS